MRPYWIIDYYVIYQISAVIELNSITGQTVPVQQYYSVIGLISEGCGKRFRIDLCWISSRSPDPPGFSQEAHSLPVIREILCAINRGELMSLNESLWKASYGIWITCGSIQACLGGRFSSADEDKTKFGIDGASF